MGDDGERAVRRFIVPGDSGGQSSAGESMDKESKMREEAHCPMKLTTGMETSCPEMEG